MSTYSIGQMNQLGDALAKAGYTPEMITIMHSNLSALEQFKGVLKGMLKIVVDKPFQVWKTIKLGTHRTAAGLSKAIEDQGDHVDDGRHVLGDDDISKQKTEVTLTIATTKELTGKNEATIHEVYDAIKTRGGQRCHTEVAFQLRRQYTDQPMNERLLIAMDLYDGLMWAFDVYRKSNGRFLDAIGQNTDHYSGDSRWVFMISN